MNHGVDRTQSAVLTGAPTESLTALGVTSYMQSLLTTVDSDAEMQTEIDVDAAGTAVAMAIALG